MTSRPEHPLSIHHCLFWQDDTWWSQRHREHQEEFGHWKDDCRGLWHPFRHKSNFCQTRWASVFVFHALPSHVIPVLNQFTHSHCLWAGSLIHLPSSSERGVLSKVRLGSLSLRKEGEKQCFLFTKHFLICTRTSGGKLHLLKVSFTCSQLCILFIQWAVPFGLKTLC